MAAAANSLNAQAEDLVHNTRRFGVAQPKRFALPATGDATSPLQMIEKIQPIAPVGWELHLLADPSARLSAAVANGRLAGVSVLGLLALLMGVLHAVSAHTLRSLGLAWRAAGFLSLSWPVQRLMPNAGARTTLPVWCERMCWSFPDCTRSTRCGCLPRCCVHG